MLALGFGLLHAQPHRLPFAQALLAGQPGEEGDEEPGEGARGVQERLIVGVEPDMPVLEGGHDAGNGPLPLAGEAVHAPDHQHVEVAPAGLLQHGLELLPGLLAEGRLLHLVDPDDLPAPLGTYPLQVSPLEGGILALGVR